MFTGFAPERVPNGSADVTSRAPAETPRYCREGWDAENQNPAVPCALPARPSNALPRLTLAITEDRTPVRGPTVIGMLPPGEHEESQQGGVPLTAEPGVQELHVTTLVLIRRLQEERAVSKRNAPSLEGMRPLQRNAPSSEECAISRGLRHLQRNAPSPEESAVSRGMRRLQRNAPSPEEMRCLQSEVAPLHTDFLDGHDALGRGDHIAKPSPLGVQLVLRRHAQRHD